MTNAAGTRHRLANRLQTVWLIAVLLGICALAGGLVFGTAGAWIALGTGVLALLIEPAAASTLTLRLYRARPIQPAEAPQLWAMLRELSARAGLEQPPVPHYAPSAVVNAFTTGSRRHAVIVLTDGLLRTLSPREIAGVIAHEIAHVVHGDVRVMGLADSISRLTSLLALIGQFAILLALPLVWLGELTINWWGLLALAVAPHLALLAQLGLSRVREFDADHTAAMLTGDPEGLASALTKIEAIARSWRGWILPGWGNPEPSWLRTHPPTPQRVARLLELSAARHGWPRGLPDIRLVQPRPAAPRPRWHAGGVWR